MKPIPIRASILTQTVYSSLKNKLIQYIDESHHGIPITDKNITLLKSKIHSISLKHRLMTSRTEWQRLQNLRYLSKKLYIVLINKHSSLAQGTPQVNLQAQMPLLTTIDSNHSSIDITIKMHEHGD